MQKHTFSLNVESAQEFIENTTSFLRSRNAKVSKSDIKELTSRLLGYENSNVFDKALKKDIQRKNALDEFDERGFHKFYPDVLLVRKAHPLKVKKLVDADPTLNFMFECPDPFYSASGYLYNTGDVLLSANRASIFSVLTSWGEKTSLTYMTYTPIEDGADQDGEWELFVASDDFKKRSQFDDGKFFLEKNPPRGPETPESQLLTLFAEQFFNEDHDFYLFERSDFDDYLYEWAGEVYSEEKTATLDALKLKFVRYSPLLEPNDIAENEIATADKSTCEFLESSGVKWDKRLLALAIESQNIPAIEFVLKRGVAIDSLFDPDIGNSYSEALLRVAGSVFNPKDLAFFKTAQDLGLNINKVLQKGRTLLHHCVTPEMFDGLVGLGADPSIEDHDGKKPERPSWQF